MTLGCSAAIKLSGEAIDIPVGGGTMFWFYYPEVKVNGDMQRLSEVDVSDGSATLSYKHGAKFVRPLVMGSPHARTAKAVV